MHYIIVIIIIVGIICFQLYSYADTSKKIKKYKSIFPKSVSAYSLRELSLREEPEHTLISEDDDLPLSLDEVTEGEDEVTVSQVHIQDASPTLLEVEHSLNMYLQKNKGAASDFHIMKDVVERYCDADEEEITTQQPIPLYLGLMGTMVGIIVGIVYIAATKGFSVDDITRSVTELMTCVAIAMSASFMGVYCTTRISWKSKDAFSRVESDKNKFYSWLQTELLPTLSGNTVNALYLLQQNLTQFNSTFQTNISGLNRALGQVKETSAEQVELINLLQDIDIRRVAQANVTVLRELRDCTGELTRFNQYMHSVSDYLTAVNALNSNINEHLNRTAAIERMGAFFEREIDQVRTREQYINEVVANVDNTLRDTFNALSEGTRNGVTELRNNSTAEFDRVTEALTAQQQTFKEALNTQRDEFAQALRSEQESFMEYLRGQKDSLSAKSEEITQIVDRIRDFSETKNAMNSLLSASREQTGKLEELIGLLGRRNREGGISSGPSKFEIPAFYKIAIGAIAGLMLLSVGISTVSLLMGISSRKEAKTEMVQPEVVKPQAIEQNVDTLSLSTPDTDPESIQQEAPSDK
jgi:biopolymer transport protein ExbB/TolQ